MQILFVEKKVRSFCSVKAYFFSTKMSMYMVIKSYNDDRSAGNMQEQNYLKKSQTFKILSTT